MDGFRVPAGYGVGRGELLRRDVVFGVLAVLFKDMSGSS